MASHDVPADVDIISETSTVNPQIYRDAFDEADQAIRPVTCARTVEMERSYISIMSAVAYTTSRQINRRDLF